MTEPEQPTTSGTRVASVGAVSSNSRVHLNVSSEGRRQPLVGMTVTVRNTLDGSSELAMGTVTQVETHNKWHEDVTSAAMESDGAGWGSGDDGDVRFADINLQACWRRSDDADHWTQSGPFLRMSPATGTGVHAADHAVINEIVAGVEGLHYCGHLAGTNQVPLPLSIPDFSGPLGAWHGGVFGRSGSGKTQSAIYMMSSLMREPSFGILAIDPQGQLANEPSKQMAFSLQGWATELGRDVIVRRISEDLRLDKDAGLFSSLLRHTKFTQELGLKNKETNEIVFDEVTRVLRDRGAWDSDSSADILRAILTALQDDDTATRIYSSPDRREQFLATLDTTLHNDNRFNEVLIQLQPIHNLFQATNPDGGTRHSLWSTLSEMFGRNQVDPAPYIVLDMSTKAPPSLAAEMTAEQQAVYDILDGPVVKSVILHHTFSALKRVAEQKSREDGNLNTMIVLDEAWRYAAPTRGAGSAPTINDDPVAATSNLLAQFARDTRKFGLGWLFISQSPTNLHPDIWSQLSVLSIGIGLSGNDLAKVEDVVADPKSLRLYRGFGDPRSTGVWPFLLIGPVSPLVANNTPIVMEVFTDFDDFRAANVDWIAKARTRMGEQLRVGPPERPDGTGGAVARPVSVSDRQAIIETNQAVRDSLATHGITDPDRDPYALDDSDAPF